MRTTKSNWNTKLGLLEREPAMQFSATLHLALFINSHVTNVFFANGVGPLQTVAGRRWAVVVAGAGGTGHRNSDGGDRNQHRDSGGGGQRGIPAMVVGLI
ncbi:unnamed protein product [Prunus armeniaca]|uniref:Uncharacterized protein n=1 Tax=Prunus armeniaca TaxID=36596 RepID=A0A6J5Y338_PRUAR|nr:unnamed protein product [Prunus armeniaca]